MSQEQVDYIVDNIEEEIDIASLEDWKVDRYINEVKDNNEQIKRLEEIYKKRVEELKHTLDQKKESLKKRNLFLTTTLGQYAKTQKLATTKTQSKLSLLSGDIVIKKAAQSIIKPTEDKERKLAELYPEHATVEEVVKTDWKEIKKKFVIQNGRAYDQESGEDVTDYVQIVEKDEEVIIK